MSTGTIDLTRAEPRVRSGGLLEEVALALGSTLDLDEVLRRLAEIGREATGAHRCSVFLLEGRHLHPAVAIGVRPDDALWEAFQEMGPIGLDGERWAMLSAGAPISFVDARDTGDFVPVEWVDRFAVGALVLVPLVSRGEPCGLMALDWAKPHPVPSDDLALLSAIGTYAGVAVANARLYESVRRKARLQEELVSGAATLASVLSGDELAGCLADAVRGLVQPRLVGVGLFDADRTRLVGVASRGIETGHLPIRLDDLPEHLVRSVRSEWEREKRPIETRAEPFFDDTLGGTAAGASWYLLVPLVVERRTRGVLVLGFEANRRLEAQERAAVSGLAALASAALERRVLLDRLARRVGQLDTLFRVSVAFTEAVDEGVVTRELNGLLAGQGIEVKGIALRDRRLARHLGGDAPTDGERAAWKGGRWQPGDEWPVLEGGALAAPMRLGRRVVGTLRVAGTLDSEDRAFVEALARGLAQVAERDALRGAVEEAKREQALASERERIAADLHDTAGAAFVAIALLGRQRAEDLGAGSSARQLLLRLAAMADEGKWEVDQAVRAQTFVPATQRGLVASLGGLARSFSSDSGIDVSVDVKGRPVRLGAEVERALYRVCHEALINAWRHADCRAIRIGLAIGADAATLEVVDDGNGLDEEFPEESTGLAGMRRAMRTVAGELHLENVEPRGARVMARVARGSG